MAKPATLLGWLTETQMNSGQPFRVRTSYGTFSIAGKVTHGGTYHYAYKRVAGKLHKVYVGKVGEIDQDAVHKATMRLSEKYTGFGRDNQAHPERG